MTDTPKEWNVLAKRLEDLAQDMMVQSESQEDEFDKHIIILWSRSLMHSAIEMRFFAAEDAQAAEAEGM